MASWTAPNITWISGDGIAFTDLNRIEENTLYLKDNQDDLISNYQNSRINGLHAHIKKNTGGGYGLTHIAITPGIAPTTTGSLYQVVLANSITKDITANWLVGSNNGGFPSGLSIAANTNYRVFIIVDTDTNTIDAGFDTSSTAANLLADATAYDEYLQVGTVRTDSVPSGIRFSEDYEATAGLRSFIRSCFPVTTVGYTANTELTCESLYNRRGAFVQFTMPEHGSALTATGSNLEYTFISSNIPIWVSGANEDTTCPATFLNGASNTKPGLLQLDATTPKLIAQVADVSGNIGATNFLSSALKGSSFDKPTFNLHVWSNT